MKNPIRRNAKWGVYLERNNGTFDPEDALMLFDTRADAQIHADVLNAEGGERYIVRKYEGKK